MENKENPLQQFNEKQQVLSKKEFIGIIDPEIYSGLEWIYHVRCDLNIKPANIVYEINLQDEIETINSDIYESVFYRRNGSVNKMEEYNIYRLKKPFITLTLQFGLNYFDNSKTLGLLRGHLVRFILLNPKLRDWKMLSKVFHMAVSRINKYSDASISKPDSLRTPLIEQALGDTKWVVDRTDSLKYNVDIADYYKSLEFAKKNYWYTGIMGVKNKNICFYAENKYKERTKQNDISEVVDALIDGKMFVSYETIKEKLIDRGERQIRETISKRMEEIKSHNKNAFGTTQYKTFMKNRKNENEIPIE